MHNLLDGHKKEIMSLKERTKAAEVVAKKAEEDRVVEVGEIRVGLDERSLEVESLRTRLQASEDRAATIEERVQTAEQKRAFVEKDWVTFKEAWKVLCEESASLKRDAKLAKN